MSIRRHFLILDHHFISAVKKRVAYLSLSPWWAINCRAKVPGEEREVKITEFFGFVHH